MAKILGRYMSDYSKMKGAYHLDSDQRKNIVNAPKVTSLTDTPSTVSPDLRCTKTYKSK